MEIFDAHAHIASWPSLEKSKANLLSGMEKHGVSGCLISNADCATFPSERKHDVLSLSATQGLQQAIAFARSVPHKVYIAVWVCPRREKTPSAELIETIERNRDIVKALKLHPFCERMAPNDPRMEPYYELAEKLDFPFLIHTALDPDSSIGCLIDAARKHPKVRFVAAHLELCSNHLYAINAISELPNVYCDCAWVEMKTARIAINELGKERVFFGTDAPVDGKVTLDHPYYLDYFDNEVGLDPESYEYLMGKAAKDFYRI